MVGCRLPWLAVYVSMVISYTYFVVMVTYNTRYVYYALYELYVLCGMYQLLFVFS